MRFLTSVCLAVFESHFFGMRIEYMSRDIHVLV